MTRTKKFFYNTTSTAVLQVVTLISGFILPGVMLNIYGSEINGLVSSITQFISLLTVVEAGLSGATVYSLYKPLADNDTNAINRVITAAKNFYYKTGYLFLGLILSCALAYPFFVSTDLLSNVEISILFVVLGANGILEFFTLAKYRALLTADQRTYVISLASILQIALNCILISVLSYTGLSIVTVRAIAIISILLRSLILWLYCKRNYRFMDFSVEPDNSALDKRWDALFIQILEVIHRGSPTIIITLFLTLNDVSIYSIYLMVISGINGILGIFKSGLSAGFGDLVARKEDAAFKKAFQQFEYLYYALITIVFATTTVTFSSFIGIYTKGADINYIDPIFAALMALDGFFYSLKNPYGMLTISAGKYKESRTQNILQAVIQIVASIILSYPLGLKGIVLGSLLANLYRDIDYFFFAPKHLIKFKFRETAVMWARSILLFIGISAIGYLIPTTAVTNYFAWFIYAAIVGIMALIIVAVVNLIFDKERAKECWQRILSLKK